MCTWPATRGTAITWTTVHPRIGIPVSSYYLADEKVLVDPLVPEEGLGWFEDKPEHLLLTNRHHYRGRLTGTCSNASSTTFSWPTVTRG